MTCSYSDGEKCKTSKCCPDPGHSLQETPMPRITRFRGYFNLPTLFFSPSKCAGRLHPKITPKTMSFTQDRSCCRVTCDLYTTLPLRCHYMRLICNLPLPLYTTWPWKSRCRGISGEIHEKHRRGESVEKSWKTWGGSTENYRKKYGLENDLV